jgi:hypothetical protein
MQRPQKTFARELQELRELGFGEGLEPARTPAQRHASADVLRLECGSMGVAVEIAQDEGEASYRVVPLVAQEGAASACTSGHWPEVMEMLHSRVRPQDGPDGDA